MSRTIIGVFSTSARPPWLSAFATGSGKSAGLAATLPIYEFTCQNAGGGSSRRHLRRWRNCSPPYTTTRRRRTVFAQTVSVSAFFDPENVNRIMASAS